MALIWPPEVAEKTLTLKKLRRQYLFVNFTGFQSARESSSRWRWQSTSAYTDWRRRTWRTTAWQSLPLPASNICGPPALGYCPYQGQEPRSGWGVSRSQVQLSGTVCQQPCEPQLSLPRRSLDIWRLTCSADWQRARGLFRTRSTNLLIIIIIIIIISNMKTYRGTYILLNRDRKSRAASFVVIIDIV